MNTTEILRFAWDASGGFLVMLKSFDFWLAVLVWVLAAPFWTGNKWPDQVVAVLPGLLGFTLGGFAIFLGFGSDDFKAAIVHRDERKSAYLSVSAAFMLFVAFQLAALLWALVAVSMYALPTPRFLYPYASLIEWGSYVSGGIGYFLFTYSLALVLRAAIRIFRLSRWYNLHLHIQAKQPGDSASQVDDPK